MEENKMKKEWETPEVILLSVNDNTEGGPNAGSDTLERMS